MLRRHLGQQAPARLLYCCNMPIKLSTKLPRTLIAFGLLLLLLLVLLVLLLNLTQSARSVWDRRQQVPVG